MTKYLNKFLIISILSVISLNAFSSIGSFVPALANAVKVASQSPSVQALAQSAWGGVSGAVAIALDAGGFFSGGSVPVSQGTYSSVPDDIPGGVHVEVHRFVVPQDARCTNSVIEYYLDYYDKYGDYYADNSETRNLFTGYQVKSNGTFKTTTYDLGEQVVNSYFKYDDAYGGCLQIGRHVYTPEIPATDNLDFSNPTLNPVNLSEDAEGKFYMNPDGVRVPVYPMTMGEAESGYLEETGQNYDFGSGLWDSTDTGGIGPEYQGLGYEDATKRANFLKDGAVIGDPGFDDQFIVHNDFLPELADWDVSHYQEIAGNDSEVIVHNFDSNGDYVDTTIDTYANLEIVQDGVTVDQTSNFSDRQTITDPALVGTVSDPGVTQVEDPASTYTGSDGLTNSGTSENTLAINESSSKTDGILNKILGQLSTATKATTAELATATNTGGLLDFFAGDPTVIPSGGDPTGDFLASVPTVESDTTAVTDSIALNTKTFDFDAYTYAVDFFGPQACYNPTIEFRGKSYTADWSFLCQFLNALGLFMLILSSFIAFKVLISGLRSII